MPRQYVRYDEGATCRVGGCLKPVLARWLCRKHYSDAWHYRRNPAYNIWRAMRSRCHCKTSQFFSYYGGRGITVCERWDSSFANFLADMGERPKGMSLERIDNNGNYEPGNCRWASRLEQANNKRTNVFLTFEGETLTIADWARRLDIKYMTLFFRIYNGWTIERAFTLPVQDCGRKSQKFPRPGKVIRLFPVKPVK